MTHVILIVEWTPWAVMVAVAVAVTMAITMAGTRTWPVTSRVMYRENVSKERRWQINILGEL